MRHWAWIHTLAALGGWAVLIDIWTPTAVFAALQDPIVSVWTIVTLIGAITAIVGVMLSVAHRATTRVISVSVELTGLLLAAVGPLTYFIAQFSLLFTDVFDQRIALVMFAYFGLSIIIYRIVVVVPRFRKEAHDERKVH